MLGELAEVIATGTLRTRGSRTMTRSRYTVIFERGDRPNQWLASVKELPECHTFGRGLEQTRVRIREALVLWEGEAAANAELLEELPLPRPSKLKLGKLWGLRHQLEALQEQNQTLLSGLVVELLDAEFSMRDVGSLTGLSHQRVNQLGGGKPGKRRAVTKRR